MSSTTPHLGSGHKRVVVDIDGTIFTLKWPELGEWIPGAANFIRTIQANGLEVMLCSTRLAPVMVDESTPRSKEDLDNEVASIRARLAEEGLEDLPIWDKPWKPGALAYVDDKAVFAGGDWRETMKQLGPFLTRKPAKKKTSMGLPANHGLSPAGIRRRINGR